MYPFCGFLLILDLERRECDIVDLTRFGCLRELRPDNNRLITDLDQVKMTLRKITTYNSKIKAEEIKKCLNICRS